MVEIVVAISDCGRSPFTTRQIATMTSLADSGVRPVIRRLRDTGFIEDTELVATGRGRAPHFLRATRVSGWSELKGMCRKLIDC